MRRQLATFTKLIFGLKMSRRLGVEWSPVRNGTADIEGITRQVIRAFSKRRSEIESVVGETGEVSAKAAELAAVTTRKAKDYRVSPGELLLEWKERADRLGLDSSALGELLGRNSYRRRCG
jgi:conjugative relaxase-like TrwC/TraI family protein